MIDRAAHRVMVNGSAVDLTPKEFDLLAFLAATPDQVFTREELLEHVWGSTQEWQDPATVTEHVRRLRLKLEPDAANPRWLHTVRGIGYRFSVVARRLSLGGDRRRRRAHHDHARRHRLRPLVERPRCRQRARNRRRNR